MAMDIMTDVGHPPGDSGNQFFNPFVHAFPRVFYPTP
jgi:hypothetical protein